MNGDYSPNQARLDQTREALSPGELKYRTLFELSPDPAFLVYDYRFVDCNIKVQELFGATREELLGKTPMDFSPPLQSDGRVSTEKALEKMRATMEGRPQIFEWTHNRQGGQIFDSEVSLTRIDIEGKTHIYALVHDITQRKNAERVVLELTQELRRQNQELQEMNRELSAFTTSVSHDLRSPISKISGYSQLILESEESLEQKHREYVEKIHAISLKMSGLIENLLELSRINRLELKKETVDLSGMAGNIAAELKEQEPQRRVEFVIPAGLTAQGDPALLEIALTNLLENAWKFTSRRPQARIELGMEKQGEKVVFFVRDNGVGFNMSDHEKLFIPFHRLHSPKDYPGNGLGLTIVQRIVNRHGGVVCIEGEEDKGAKVAFSL